MRVKIYRICKDNPLPIQAYSYDAGYDVFAAEYVSFDEPGDIKLVPLGIIAQAPEGFHFKLCIRSSVSKTFSHPNAPGIIDSSYCGPNDEIKLMLKAPDADEGYYWPLEINKGDRIGQLILERNHEIEWDEQEKRDFGGASRGGFGSSGK